MRYKQAICMLVGVFLPMSAFATTEYYRYVDDNGIVSISRQGVPQEYIANGYEVLNERGRVVRVVPRAPTAEEFQQMREAKARADHDRYLLRLYNVPADVERAKNRRLAELDNLITRVRANLLSVTTDKAELLTEAANFERSGRKVPDKILQDIENLERKELRYHQEIEEHEQKKDEAKRSFAQDKERIRQLTGKN